MGTADTRNPDGDEGLKHCFGGDLRGRECLRPKGEVRQYRRPEETGSGPTRSICT